MKRVFLHVGSPKTGTSLLQDVLFRNQRTLAAHGVHYPADRFDAHFLAALDLMGIGWGGLEREAGGAWQRLVDRVRAVHSGTVIVSHEILARASAADIERAYTDLGAGAEVHLVLSARDLARQIPAEWQENVKHRRAFGYRRFLEVIREPGRDHPIGAWFWGVQDVPDILERWGARLPADRVHLVTVPPRDAAQDLLWRRFVTAFGLDGIPLDLETGVRRNPSLGGPETTLIRRLNVRLNGTVEGDDYRRFVRELLAHRTLANRADSPRLSLPPEVLGWAEGISREWVAALGTRGYDVIGVLEDLLPGEMPPYTDPDRPRLREVNDASLDAIEALVGEAVRLQGEIERLNQEVEKVLESPGERFKRRLYRTLRDRAAGRALLRVYRRARHRPDVDAL